MHEILSLPEDEERLNADIYIEPNDSGMLTDEDSADEDESGLLDNLSSNQLAARAETVFHDEHRTTEIDDEIQLTADDGATILDEHSAGVSAETRSVSPILGYKTAKWSHGTSLTTIDCIYPEANHVKFRDFFFSLLHAK